MSKITAVISAFNEEGNIERCLKSLEFADEIIVVDHESSDNTTAIAKKYTNKVFSQKNNQAEIDLQKNFGFTKASNNWILCIDADEEVSPELAKEIKTVLKGENGINGYWIPRKNIIFGKVIEHTGWFPDPQLRLFRKGKGKYIKAHVHEHLQLEGESAYLNTFLIHHNYDTVSQFIRRTVDIYAPNEAKDYLDKGYQFDYLDAIRFPVKEFISRFFAREGYKDGLHGLMLSILMAFYHFMIFAYIWEKKDFIEVNSSTFLQETETEVKKAHRDIMSWFYNEKLKAIKNPVNKNLQRILKRIPR